MKFTLVFTGKTDSGYIESGVDMYVRRLERYVPVNIRIIDDKAKIRKSPGKKSKNRNIQTNYAFDPSTFIIILDEKGEGFGSLEFARIIEQTMIDGYREVAFITGGAYGFSEEVSGNANRIISLSKMTFSHQMVRLILAEQIYRAMTIIRGEPYHHE